jgi:hypothetical protein
MVDGEVREGLAGYAVVFAKADGEGEEMGMYDVHSKPVLCRHVEQ